MHLGRPRALLQCGDEEVPQGERAAQGAQGGGAGAVSN